MHVLSKVRRFVREHDLIRPGARVVCAVSGGSDSVALAHILAEFVAAGDATLVGLAHLNHQLRAAADRDESFCRQLADRLATPIVVERDDVRSRADRDGRSLEDAAHAARYEFFARVRTHFAADVVALGHTRDDQAETFLLRLVRGAGPRGLASMYPRHDDVVRPLLDCTRAELRAFLAERGATFVEDETNADLTIPRNRVRSRLLPLLASEFNPNIVEVLAREADLARDLWSWLEPQLDAFGTNLDIDQLRLAPLPLRRLAVWRAMSIAAHSRPVAFEHVAAALALLDASDGASIDAPGHRVQRKGSRLVLTEGRLSRGSKGSKGSGGSEGSEGSMNSLNPLNHLNPLNFFFYPLSIPGEVIDTQRGFTVSVEPAEVTSSGNPPCENVGKGLTAVIRRDRIGDGLAVRNRRPGDRFRPVGLNGRKKLQDLFVDRKIAREDRDFVPIVVDGRDRIVWVAGHGIDEAFQVTDAAQAVLLLRLRRA
jgi:tRNA(Ile)-lysidine synthase